MYNATLEINHMHKIAKLTIKFRQSLPYKMTKNEVKIKLYEDKSFNRIKIKINTDFCSSNKEDQKKVSTIIEVMNHFNKLIKELENHLIHFEDFEKVVLKKDYSLEYPRFKLEGDYIYIYIPCLPDAKHICHYDILSITNYE